jgi:hypothetical protein
MDGTRRIRFLVAPLLFLASLGWGVLVSNSDAFKQLIERYLPQNEISKVVSVVTGGGVIIFTLGVVIGTISYVFLRSCAVTINYLRSNDVQGIATHELFLKDTAFNEIWAKLNLVSDPNRHQDFYAAMSFDHGILYKRNRGVHNWMVRRWNAFSIGVTSVTALALSLIVGPLLSVPLSCTWLIPVTLVALVFAATARWAWRDTMGMLAFQAELPVSPSRKRPQSRS